MSPVFWSAFAFVVCGLIMVGLAGALCARETPSMRRARQPHRMFCPGCDGHECDHECAYPRTYEPCILCANGNDLPDGEYCRACGRMH